MTSPASSTSLEPASAATTSARVLDYQQELAQSPVSLAASGLSAPSAQNSRADASTDELDDDDDEDSDDQEEHATPLEHHEPIQQGVHAQEVEDAAREERTVPHHAAQVDGEEGDTDDETDEDEDSDNEEEEPTLKYEKLGGYATDVLKRDTASAITVANKRVALGTHAGLVHVMDVSGACVKSFRPHTASVLDICMDVTADFVASASMDGQVVIHSVSSAESYVFDMKRPMRTIALEPDFAKRTTRAFVCGGTAGTLVMHEKGWLGHKETLLHQGEGPVYQVRWRSRLIAWANDLGVKVYDTVSQTRITFIDRPANSPRADLFKCTLHWQDDSTLLIAWADHIKVARVRSRPTATAGAPSNNGATKPPPLVVEITAVFQLDCMIAGVVPHPTPQTSLVAAALPASSGTTTPAPALTSFLILAYTPPDNSLLSGDGNEAANDRAAQARRAAERPELRIVSRSGEELSGDVLAVAGFQAYGCNDYWLAEGDEGTAAATSTDESRGKCYFVLSPKDVIVVRARDRRDHVHWLVERERFEEALEEVQHMGETDRTGDVDVVKIGQRYMEHLVGDGDFVKAAHLCPKVCGHDAKLWETWIYLFASNHQLQAIIPYVPTESPRLDHLVYEVILADLTHHDLTILRDTLFRWPREIYDIPVVIIAVQSQLEHLAATAAAGSAGADKSILKECLADLYIANRQPGKALPYFLQLRRPHVFDLIRDNNLFADVQDQALQLVEFDHELMEKRKQAGEAVEDTPGSAITLLVDHIHSIPVHHVVQQLQPRPQFLFLYLDSLFRQDPYIVSDFADSQVQLYAKYAPNRLIDFLRASDYYNLERAYAVCKEADLVLEMVYLLGRMGGDNNRRALTLIIERLGDVNRAIDFVKEQNDDDLWEDLLRYSETRPTFIRGLLENVGPEIDPIRLIRRIKNGLEIPGLKPALLKILHDFNLQTSLLEGCRVILDGDCAGLTRSLQRDQSSGFPITLSTPCPICSQPLYRLTQSLVLLFLCRHMVHATCVNEADLAQYQTDPLLAGLDVGEGSYARALGNKITLAAVIRPQLTNGCPVCLRRAEGTRA